MRRITRNASITGSIRYITTTNNPSNKPNLPSGEKRRKSGEEFSYTSSYHSSGELVLYPWGYTKNPPKDKPVFVSIGENISKLDNYTLTQSVNMYPTIGDDCDWGYGQHGIFSYTIELGTVDATSDPQELLEMCSAHVNVNLYVCQRAQLLEKT